MHHPLSLAVAVLFVATTSLAQTTLVSPAGLATVEGDANNVFPFGQTTPRRYMQIHADLGTTPLVITKLNFRINASTTNFTGTRDHDFEVYMGDALPTAQQLPSLTFDSNYATPKTTVFPRQIVTWGPQGQGVSPGPNPFNGTMEIVLTTPYVYTGTAPLIWEVAYFGHVNNGTNSAYDADASGATTASSTVTGIGCTPTGLGAPMTHSYVVADATGTLMMNGTIAAAPANSLALMAIGFTNPNLPIPDLCTSLYTDATLLQVLGFTSATGAFTADTPTGAIIAPNSAPGLQIFTQAFVLDTASPFALPFAASNGRVSTIPAPGAGNLVTRLWNTVGGTTATEAFFSVSTIGYALVTEFTHQ
jgi:hypothetical protein